MSKLLIFLEVNMANVKVAYPISIDTVCPQHASLSDFSIFYFHWPDLKNHWPQPADHWDFVKTVMGCEETWQTGPIFEPEFSLVMCSTKMANELSDASIQDSLPDTFLPPWNDLHLWRSTCISLNLSPGRAWTWSDN